MTFNNTRLISENAKIILIRVSILNTFMKNSFNFYLSISK